MWQYGYGGKVKDELKEAPDSSDAEAQKKDSLMCVGEFSADRADMILSVHRRGSQESQAQFH